MLATSSALGSETVEPLERAVPFNAGEEVLVSIVEPHMYNVDDAVAKIDGYIVSVSGGGAYIGQKRLVRIEDAGRNSARATLVGTDGANVTKVERKPAAKRSTPATRRKPATPPVDGAGPAADGAEEGAETPANGDALESKPRRRGRRGGRRRSAATADAAAVPDSTSD